jgi:hypothetical protein
MCSSNIANEEVYSCVLYFRIFAISTLFSLSISVSARLISPTTYSGELKPISAPLSAASGKYGCRSSSAEMTQAMVYTKIDAVSV